MCVYIYIYISMIITMYIYIYTHMLASRVALADAVGLVQHAGDA